MIDFKWGVVIISCCVFARAEIGEIDVRTTPATQALSSAHDESTLWLKTGTRITVMVTDPAGQRLGVDATTFKTVKEIPGSDCEVEFVTNPYTKEEHSEAYERFTLAPARKGIYHLYLHGLQTGPYEISTASLSRDGSSEPSKDLEGMITEGENKHLTLTFDPAPHSAPSFVDLSARAHD